MSEAPLNREEQIAFIKNGPARRAAAIERWSHNWSHKAIQDQAARIKELEAQLAWQPIETAPKTGISVLLWDEDSIECTIGWYRVNHTGDQWRNENDLGIEATHWMPLPNMPKENKTNE